MVFRPFVIGAPRDDGDAWLADDVVIGCDGDPPRWRVLFRGELGEAADLALKAFWSECPGRAVSVGFCPREMSAAELELALGKLRIVYERPPS